MAKKVQPQETPQIAGRFSFNAFTEFVNANFSLILLLAIAFALGFLSGSLWTQNKMLRNGSGTDTAAVDTKAAEAAAKKKLEQVPAFDPKTDHFRGNKDAKVVLIEYSDFECPYCNKFHPTMLDLMKKYSDQVVWVYRHYPLSFHPNAQPLAQASECVSTYGSEDAFWKFADSIYEKMGDGTIYGEDTESRKVSEDMILSLAGAAGADTSKIKACISNKEMVNKVKDSQAGGSKAGVTGTPGTIIISKKGGYDLIPGALPLEQVEALLENHL